MARVPIAFSALALVLAAPVATQAQQQQGRQPQEQSADQQQASGTVSLDQFMGKTVIGADGKELGEVSDIIVDPESGEAQQLVIDSGGFLGIGEKEIAVDFAEATLAAEQDAVQVSSMTQADVEGTEEFQRTEDMQFYGGADSDVPARSSAGSQ